MPPKRHKWSHREERRAEDRRREEIIEVAVALAAAHGGEEAVGQTLNRMLDELRKTWLMLDATERHVEGSRHEKSTWQRRAFEAEREAREVKAEAQAAAERAAASKSAASRLAGELGDARREIEVLRKATGASHRPPELVIRAQAMPADAAWLLVRQQAALRGTVVAMRADVLKRPDAVEVLRLCTMLTIADEGSARAAALEDLRAALVRLRTRAAHDSFHPPKAVEAVL